MGGYFMPVVRCRSAELSTAVVFDFRFGLNPREGRFADASKTKPDENSCARTSHVQLPRDHASSSKAKTYPLCSHALGPHTMEGEGSTQHEKRFKVRTPPIPFNYGAESWKTASVISSDIEACPSPVRTYTVRVRPRYRGGDLIMSDLFSRLNISSRMTNHIFSRPSGIGGS